jgi:hypothetical protein
VRAPGLHPPQNRAVVGRVPSPGIPLQHIMRIADLFCPKHTETCGSRVSATHPNPAWHPKPSSLWPPIPPTMHPSVPRAPPEPPRSTLDLDRGYYGEAPVRLRRCGRAVGDAVPLIPPNQQRRTADCVRWGSPVGVPLNSPGRSFPLSSSRGEGWGTKPLYAFGSPAHWQRFPRA